jgi:hypothetical protein
MPSGGLAQGYVGTPEILYPCIFYLAFTSHQPSYYFRIGAVLVLLNYTKTKLGKMEEMEHILTVLAPLSRSFKVSQSTAFSPFIYLLQTV